MQPDPLGPAAADVVHEVEEYARQHPQASPVAIVAHLARRWIPGRLKRRWRP